jgi:ABC-type multidrug transport system fused ATPase/permease subunit
VVLDGGRVVEQGTHERLLDAGGLYASMWATQFHEHSSPAPGLVGVEL